MNEKKKLRHRAPAPSGESREVMHEVNYFDLTQRERDAMPPFESPDFDRWVTAVLLRHNRSKINDNGVAVLQALNLCFENEVSPPRWLARQFLTRIHGFSHFEKATLDEAFDVPPISEKKRAAIARRKRLIWPVSDALMAVLKKTPETPIDVGLFEAVGDTLGIGATLCQELYAEGVELYGTPDLKAYKRLLESLGRNIRKTPRSPRRLARN
ncbi:hypothetical protein LJR130_003021 [Variovorax sp. LjRoot130]|uniref:hypothetical protein n=1 Tax=Variovorax sp. LjRoot130 TaxID=3342261 RepID=UPI003ED0D048